MADDGDDLDEMDDDSDETEDYNETDDDGDASMGGQTDSTMTPSHDDIIDELSDGELSDGEPTT